MTKNIIKLSGEAFIESYINDIENNPSIIILPGGSYLYTTQREGEPVGKEFYNRGYNVFVLKYNTYFTSREECYSSLDKEVVLKERTVWPMPLYDVADTFKHIIDNNDQYNADLTKISVLGFSAGGHLAAMYSNMYNQPILTDKYQGYNLKPNTVCLCYPLLDFVPFMREVQNQYSMLKDLVNMNMLGYYENVKEEDAYIFRVRDHITKDTPPTFIWHTQTDEIVPFIDTLKYTLKLEETGVKFSLHTYDIGLHGLSLATKETVDNYTDELEEVATWLKQYFKWSKKYN